jgi:hypothetical protein
MNQFLHREDVLQIIDTIIDLALNYRYDSEKHRIIILDDLDNELLFFRLPVDLNVTDSLEYNELDEVNYIILLIQSGSASLGYFEEEETIDHKVFKSYMVRKKQGKSQISYLNSKGKSRAGSRVRLANTIMFFENINERLHDYFEEYDIHRVAISCSKTLLPYVYNSKKACPFEKKDKRLFKIPKHIHTPNYEILMSTQQFLLKGELIWEEENQYLKEELIY